MTIPGTDSKVVSKAPPPFALSDLHLIHATSPAIRQRTWSNNRLEWGKAFDDATYRAREQLLSTQDFTDNDKLKVWILVPKTFDPSNQDENLDHIVAAVESFERPGIVATKEHGIKDVRSVSIASVFTPARYRGYGYGTLMMTLLWKEIEKMPGVEFTFLYSDVGPTFYGRLGWTPRASYEIEVPVSHPVATPSSSTQVALQTVLDQDLSAIMAKDDLLLRKSLQHQLNNGNNVDKAFVAATPEPNCITWLHARSRFTARTVGKQVITALGAKDSGSDSYVLWFHGLPKKLYILRWRLDTNVGEDVPRALMAAAQAEAQAWGLTKVIIWNPEPSLAQLLGLEIKYREDAIPCLGLINSTRDTNSVEWVLNEKYAW
ncbi:hypothetical protein EDD11_008054 [Mortierella claussenii]|nr:hypothetical protein EDD11_008054 [Mortierella claussenii]